MRRLAIATLILLAGVVAEVWLALVGMSHAFSVEYYTPFSFSFADLRENWVFLGSFYGLPVLAVSLCVVAFRISKKRPTHAPNK